MLNVLNCSPKAVKTVSDQLRSRLQLTTMTILTKLIAPFNPSLLYLFPKRFPRS